MVLLAISQTPDARGPWWIYLFNVTFFANEFFDYPQLGMNQDALIFTANVFGGLHPRAEVFAIAKALVYN